MTGKKLIGFSVILLILIIGIGVVSAADNTTQTLENATPDDGKTFESIQTAIDSADENGTVELEGIYTGQGNPINITKSITIKGKNNATLNADKKSTILNITKGNVILKNIGFINSNSQSKAAITSNGNLTVEECYFKNNVMSFNDQDIFTNPDLYYSEEYGASVYSTGDLTVLNSIFEDNSAIADEYIDHDYSYSEAFEPYHIWHYYAGAICSKGNLAIKNSKFKGSTVTCCGKITIITDSTFTKSHDALKILSDATVKNCSFTKNSGFVVYTIRNVLIDSCSFCENTNGDSRDSTIQSLSGELHILNSTFKNSDKCVIESRKYVSVSNCSFENNTHRAVDGVNVEINNSTFKDNRDDYWLGIILADRINVTNSVFSNNLECAIISHENANIDGKTYTGETVFDNALNKTKLIRIDVLTSSVAYASGKYPKVRLTFIESGNVVEDYWVRYTILKGSKRLVFYKNWDYDYTAIVENKEMTFKIPNLNVGTYKIQIVHGTINSVPKATITFKITKAGTIIKAPKITAKYKKSKYFKITVKHKTTKKPVKNTYVKVKIDKKTYKVKTNSKGIAKVKTKSLNVGKHKVVISSGNSNYSMSAKSSITIKR